MTFSSTDTGRRWPEPRTMMLCWSKLLRSNVNRQYFAGASGYLPSQEIILTMAHCPSLMKMESESRSAMKHTNVFTAP